RRIDDGVQRAELLRAVLEAELALELAGAVPLRVVDRVGAGDVAPDAPFRDPLGVADEVDLAVGARRDEEAGVLLAELRADVRLHAARREMPGDRHVPLVRQ